jgi:hypothetical protein
MVIRFGYTKYEVDETAEMTSANCKKTHLNYGHHLQSKPLTRLQTGNSATAIKFACISVLTIFQSTQLHYGTSYLHRKWLKRRISIMGTLYKWNRQLQTGNSPTVNLFTFSAVTSNFGPQ